MNNAPYKGLGTALHRTPLIIAMILLIVGGLFLLNLADAQARDTVRKHHLEDIEQALYAAEQQHGTFPPYNQATWCGQLDAPDAVEVQQQIEAALRAQNDKYANPEKPFPHDPLAEHSAQGQGYFYWKHSPASFELNAKLEADQNGDRSTYQCGSTAKYDYAIASVWRQ